MTSRTLVCTSADLIREAPAYQAKVHPRYTDRLQAGQTSGRGSLAALQGRELATRNPSSNKNILYVDMPEQYAETRKRQPISGHCKWNVFLYTLRGDYWPSRMCRKNGRILLVILLQSSRSTFSWGNFLSFFAFQEDMLSTPISVLGG